MISGEFELVDNGDGTITDNATGLMWENKTPTGSLHHGDNVRR